MSVMRRLKNVVRGQGIAAIPAKMASALYDRAFECRHGLETLAIAKLDGLTIRAGERTQGFYYEGMRMLPLRRLFAELRHLVPPDAALVDLGCGKGKVLLAAAEAGVAKIRGVEFAHELCEQARVNWAAFQSRTAVSAVVDVIESDAGVYPIQPDESLFFLFNPFNEVVLDRVLTNVSTSVVAHPRRVYIAAAYLSERYRRVFAAHPEYALDREVKSWGCRFTIYAMGPVAVDAER